MEVTKREIRAESKEVKRPKIDSAIIEELTHYLGYGKGEAPDQAEGQRLMNYRNGSSKKTLLSEDGKLEIDIARDRTGEFEPQFIRKGQKRFGGFDTKIIAMYRPGYDSARDQTLPGRAIQSGGLQ